MKLRVLTECDYSWKLTEKNEKLIDWLERMTAEYGSLYVVIPRGLLLGEIQELEMISLVCFHHIFLLSVCGEGNEYIKL